MSACHYTGKHGVAPADRVTQPPNNQIIIRGPSAQFAVRIQPAGMGGEDGVVLAGGCRQVVKMSAAKTTTAQEGTLRM
jgi:hypothetical protein